MWSRNDESMKIKYRSIWTMTAIFFSASYNSIPLVTMETKKLQNKINLTFLLTFQIRHFKSGINGVRKPDPGNVFPMIYQLHFQVFYYIRQIIGLWIIGWIQSEKEIGFIRRRLGMDYVVKSSVRGEKAPRNEVVRWRWLQHGRPTAASRKAHLFGVERAFCCQKRDSGVMIEDAAVT